MGNIKIDEGYNRVDYQTSRIKGLEIDYMFYKRMYEYLKRILNDDKMSLDEFWKIVSRYYSFDLFDSVETIEDCERLKIDYKRLKTNYLLYKRVGKDLELYNEDWIILDNEFVDTRKVYNDSEINELLDSGKITVLSTWYQRKASKKYDYKYNENLGCYYIYHNDTNIIRSYCDSCEDEIESLTFNNNYAVFPSKIYDNPTILQKIRDNYFTEEKLIEDIDYCRFRALEFLNLIKSKCNTFDEPIEQERLTLIKEL